MNKSKEGLVAVNENGIFYKIKNFFKGLFYNNKNREIIKEDKNQDTVFNMNAQKNKTFEEYIKVKENKELKDLLNLQKLFKMGRVKEKDLSEHERIGLEKLYNQQIYDLNQSINRYKNNIISIRKKLSENN